MKRGRRLERGVTARGKIATVVVMCGLGAALAAPDVGAPATHSAQLHMMQCAKQGFPHASPHAAFCFLLILADQGKQVAGSGWIGPGKVAQRPGCLAAHWTGVMGPPQRVLVGGGSWCQKNGQSGELRFIVHATADGVTPGAYVGLGKVAFRSPARVDPATLKGVNADKPLTHLTFTLYLGD